MPHGLLPRVNVRPYVELLRPPNVATALADVLAGWALAGLGNGAAVPWLLLATAALYAGGIVLNDVLDRHIDAVERPERPIPSGRASARAAAALAGSLLALGVLAAAMASAAAAAVAVTIAALVVLYDAVGKRYSALAPLNMGLCRAFNLLLGVAAVPAALPLRWPLAAIPLLYIYAVTALSRGEVHGGGGRRATVALGTLLAAIGGLALVGARAGSRALPALVIAGALAWRVVPPFAAARRTASPAAIRTAVKRGVLSLVLLDAALAAAFAGPLYAAAVLATGIAAGWLARRFAVT